MTPFEVERELTRLIDSFLDRAENVRKFCLEHQRPLPSIIAPFFGPALNEPIKAALVSAAPADLAPKAAKRQPPSVSRTSLSNAYILPPKPDYGQSPDGASEDWVPVPLRGASTPSLILYLINHLKKSPSSTELVEHISSLRGKTGPSTISMAVQKLVTDGWVEGDKDGWSLRKPANGIIAGERLWLPVTQLRPTDRAAVRREVLIPALRLNGPMSVGRIANCLRDCRWLTVPIDSNLVKNDCRILGAAGIITKEGLEWRLVSDPKHEEEAAM